jgi:hypothetical protein
VILSLQEFVVVAFGLLLAILSTKNLAAMWRGKTRHGDRPPAWWLWGGPLWRGFVRGMPFATVAWWIFLIAYVDTLLTNRGVVPKHQVLLPDALVGLSFVLLMLISLFNWPSVLVAPYLRGQRGAIAEWLSKGRRGRAARPGHRQ